MPKKFEVKTRNKIETATEEPAPVSQDPAPDTASKKQRGARKTEGDKWKHKVSICMNDEQYEGITAIASARRITVSALLNGIIQKYIDENEKVVQMELEHQSEMRKLLKDSDAGSDDE